MTEKQAQKVMKYWQKIAEHDYKTMLWLFKGRRYPDALFFGHIVLEKVLKGLVVQKTKEQAPYTHNLTRLAELASCDLLEDQWQILDAVNKFNIKSRYPDYKLKFYQDYNKRDIVKLELDKIKKLYKNLWQGLRQESK